MLNYHPTLLVLGVLCVALMVGFSYREQRWGPWLMLVSIVTLLALIAWSIINQAAR